MPEAVVVSAALVFALKVALLVALATGCRTPARRAPAAILRDAARAALVEGPAGGDHNVLLTSRYMLVVPRRAANAGGVPLNALGFAGLLLLRGSVEAALRGRDPAELLCEAAGLA